MKSESTILQSARLIASKIGAIMFRNNTGSAYQGQAQRFRSNTVIIENPRFIQFGLCEGSSDLIGYISVTISTDMVGRQVAVFTAIETKTETGRATSQQKHFIKTVNEAGGIAFVARSDNDVLEGFRSWIKTK